MTPLDRTRLLALCGAGGFLLVAAVWDILRRRIPNFLTVSMALCGLGFSFWRAGWTGLGLGFGALVGAVLVLQPLWAKGGLGAGDVKLFAALGAWLGLPMALWGLLYTGACGGVLALVYLGVVGKEDRKKALTNVANAVLIQAIPEVDRQEVRKNPKRGIPYAVAIAAGGVSAILLHGWR
jgi:prepilin peptidase CpaA